MFQIFLLTKQEEEDIKNIIKNIIFHDDDEESPPPSLRAEDSFSSFFPPPISWYRRNLRSRFVPRHLSQWRVKYGGSILSRIHRYSFSSNDERSANIWIFVYDVVQFNSIINVRLINPSRVVIFFTGSEINSSRFSREGQKPEIFEFLIILKRGDFLCDSVSLDFSNLPRFHAQNLRDPVVTITGGGGGHRRGERLDNSGQETKERGEQGLVLNFKRSGETSGRPTGLQSEIKR